MKPGPKGALFLLVTFVLGAASGALGLGLYQRWTGWGGPSRDPARFQQVLLERLTRELDLRSDQRTQVEALLRETGQEFAKLREEFGPRFREIRGQSRDRIRAILDPAQQAKFESLVKDWERKVERRRGGPAGRGGGESKAP